MPIKKASGTIVNTRALEYKALNKKIRKSPNIVKQLSGDTRLSVHYKHTGTDGHIPNIGTLVKTIYDEKNESVELKEIFIKDEYEKLVSDKTLGFSIELTHTKKDELKHIKGDLYESNGFIHSVALVPDPRHEQANFMFDSKNSGESSPEYKFVTNKNNEVTGFSITETVKGNIIIMDSKTKEVGIIKSTLNYLTDLIKENSLNVDKPVEVVDSSVESTESLQESTLSKDLEVFSKNFETFIKDSKDYKDQIESLEIKVKALQDGIDRIVSSSTPKEEVKDSKEEVKDSNEEVKDSNEDIFENFINNLK